MSEGTALLNGRCSPIIADNAVPISGIIEACAEQHGLSRAEAAEIIIAPLLASQQQQQEENIDYE